MSLITQVTELADRYYGYYEMLRGTGDSYDNERASVYYMAAEDLRRLLTSGYGGADVRL